MAIKKKLITMQVNEFGVSFWRDGSWIADLSTLLEDGEAIFNLTHFNIKVSRKYKRVYLQAKNCIFHKRIAESKL